MFRVAVEVESISKRSRKGCDLLERFSVAFLPSRFVGGRSRVFQNVLKPKKTSTFTRIKEKPIPPSFLLLPSFPDTTTRF